MSFTSQIKALFNRGATAKKSKSLVTSSPTSTVAVNNASGAKGLNKESLVSAANAWREAYNPLRGLNIHRAVSLLENAQRGYYADLQWTYKFIEERDATLFALIARRISAILELDWDVKALEKAELPDGGTEAMALKQVATLKAAYGRLDNLKEAIEFLALGSFRGYSHLEKIRRSMMDEAGEGNAEDILHLEPVLQWHWFRESFYAPWQYVANAGMTNTGIPIETKDFIIREVARAVNPIALLAWVRKGLSQKDWDAFIEIYGIGGVIVIGPPNVPAEKEAQYQAAAEDVAEGASGYLPNGSDAKFPAANRANIPFKEHLDFQNAEIVLAGTGGKLTMLNDPTGLGSGQSKSHEDTFEEIATAEAKKITEIFQRQFDAEVLEREHPGEPVLAYFELQTVEEEARAKVTFEREVWKTFQADHTVADMLANLTDLKALTRDVGLPPNEEYTEPYVPVTIDPGQEAVTGATTKDSEGDIVGGVVNERIQNAAPHPGPLPAGEGVGRPVPLVNRAGLPNQSLLTSAATDLAGAVQADFGPIAKRLQAILEIDDPEILKNRMRAFQAELKKLGKDIKADPAQAKVLEDAMAAGMVNGFEEGKATTTK